MRASVLVLSAALLLAGCASGAASEAPTEPPTPVATVSPEPGTTPGGESPTATANGCPGDGLASVPPLHPSVDDYPEVTLTLAGPGEGCVVTMAVRHAATPAHRAHGLMEVPALPDGTGMLFTYPDVAEERTGGYYMKNTLVPLDIAYLARDGTIQQIVAMEPCGDADPCPTYPPERPYRAALEVPQGWFARVRIAAGWRVVLPTA